MINAVDKIERFAMIDWKKKIEKACPGDIHPDEQLEAGLFVQPARSNDSRCLTALPRRSRQR
jgi:hypothetical protein